MKTSPRMQSIITRICQKHGVDLTELGAHLRLEMESYQPLVIENIGPSAVSVCHYREQSGDLIQDPEIVFFTGWSSWVPTEVTQVIGGHRVYVELFHNASVIFLFKPEGQSDLANFAELWAQNITDQGWLKNGTPA